MSKTVMTADDSLSIRQMVKLTLNRIGYTVVEAPDGVTAARLLAEQPVQMLITDLNMPGMNGIELIKTVRAMPQYRFIPILMLTTESQQDKKMEGKAAGASGWIIKPFTPDQLIKTVQRLLP